MGAEQREWFEKAYQALANVTNSRPKLGWMGLPWCWCYAYACTDNQLIEGAYLLPNPESTKIAITFRSSFFANTPPESLPKPLHTGIAAGVLINHQTWCEWELNSQDLLDSIVQLLESACTPN